PRYADHRALHSFPTRRSSDLASGTCWLLSLNPSNTANQLLATDANRGRILSIMLLAQQGGMPLGHLFAGFLTHYMSPPWVRKPRSEEHTSELQSRGHLVCRLL